MKHSAKDSERAFAPRAAQHQPGGRHLISPARKRWVAARQNTSPVRGVRLRDTKSTETTRLTPAKPLSRHLLLRYLKFNLVGFLGILIQLVALALLKSALHLDYLLATALAVETAVLHNFLWHERFTWADRVHIAWRVSLRRLAHFNLTTGAVSILGNLFFMRWLVGDVHLPYLVANGISIALCSLANFLVADLFVFRPAADLRE
jgi:putative flippase GtrA